LSCLKCKYLKELYEGTHKSNRDYWLMTELFVLLHGSDVCDSKKLPFIFNKKKEED